MIRSELVFRIAVENPHLREAEAVVDTIPGTISDAIASGYRVELCEFGAFSLSKTRARQG